MDKAISNLPGIETSFSQPIRDNVLESISQVDGQVVIKVRGEDLTPPAQSGARHRLGYPAGAGRRSRVHRSRRRAPADDDRYRSRAAAHYGVNVGDVQDLIETALAGKATSELWEGEKHFSVVVRLHETDRTLANLMELPVATPDGAQVRPPQR